MTKEVMLCSAFLQHFYSFPTSVSQASSHPICVIPTHERDSLTSTSPYLSDKFPVRSMHFVLSPMSFPPSPLSTPAPSLLVTRPTPPPFHHATPSPSAICSLFLPVLVITSTARDTLRHVVQRPLARPRRAPDPAAPGAAGDVGMLGPCVGHGCGFVGAVDAFGLGRTGRCQWVVEGRREGSEIERSKRRKMGRTRGKRRGVE